MTSTIEQNVMGAVRVVYLARRLTSAAALKLYVCVASLWGIGQLVWVSKVFENLANVGLAHSLQFTVAAVLNTDLLVQLALLALALAAVSLFLDFVRPRSLTRFAL
jgi:hypothetical protein